MNAVGPWGEFSRSSDKHCVIWMLVRGLGAVRECVDTTLRCGLQQHSHSSRSTSRRQQEAAACLALLSLTSVCSSALHEPSSAASSRHPPCPASSPLRPDRDAPLLASLALQQQQPAPDPIRSIATRYLCRPAPPASVTPPFPPPPAFPPLNTWDGVAPDPLPSLQRMDRSRPPVAQTPLRGRVKITDLSAFVSTSRSYNRG